MAVFSVDIAFASHFVVPHHSYRSDCGIGYASKNYLKYLAIRDAAIVVTYDMS